MASINIFSTISHRSPELPASVRTSQYPIGYHPRRRPRSLSFAGDSSEIPTEKAEIELEFIGPKPGSDGSYPVEKAKAISGEKLLRNIMLDNKIELYATYGKVMNCGGGGSCGTCIVEIIDGADLLNERTNTELRYLKKLLNLLVAPETRILEASLSDNCWKQREFWQGRCSKDSTVEEVKSQARPGQRTSSSTS